MLRHYLVLALRSVRRNKLHSFLGIFGLSMGLACSMLVLLNVYDEFSYDRFHSKSKRIYRVLLDSKAVDPRGHTYLREQITEEIASTLRTSVPGVESIATIRPFSG